MSRFDADAAMIGEGLCPKGHGPLVRVDNHGQCAACNLGYRLRPATEDEKWMGEIVIVEEVLTMEFDVPDVFKEGPQ